MCPGDPRGDLKDFVQIGEGSTAIVMTALKVFLENEWKNLLTKTNFCFNTVLYFLTVVELLLLVLPFCTAFII